MRKDLRSWLLLVIAGAVALLVGCSADTEIDFSESLTFAMVGSYETPEGAEGNSDPKFVNVTFVDASLTKADGTVVDLYEGEPVAYRIINRPQIIHEVDMSSYVGETLSAVTVTFDTAVVGGGKVEEEMAAVLTSPSVDTGSLLTVESAVKKRMEIHLQWKNTVTLDKTVDPPTETLSAPGLSATLIND